MAYEGHGGGVLVHEANDAARNLKFLIVVFRLTSGEGEHDGLALHHRAVLNCGVKHRDVLVGAIDLGACDGSAYRVDVRALAQFAFDIFDDGVH
jgi:hypothetical protein